MGRFESHSHALSLALRHKPESLGLTLDPNGWADVHVVLQSLHITLPTLVEIVKTNNKQRFTLSPDNTKIRANQGHSVAVNLELKPVKPPPVLYHGTAEKNLESIFKEGLLKGSRQHVHLSSSLEVAYQVGKRHGSPIVLTVLAKGMHTDGLPIFLSENRVYLAEHVPVKYLQRTQRVPPVTEPIYDEVFIEGTRILNNM